MLNQFYFKTRVDFEPNLECINKNVVAITFMRYSFVFSKIRSHPEAADNFKTKPLKKTSMSFPLKWNFA